MQEDDPYFGELGLQLIRTPEASRRLLERAARDPAAIPAPPGTALPLAQARSWIRRVVHADLAPPAAARFLAFPQEEKRFDVVRAAYEAGGLEIETAQTRHVVCVRIRGFERPPGKPLEATIASAAEKLLALDEPARFEKTGSQQGIELGTRVFGPQETTTSTWPIWTDELHWWSDGTDIGFITLKANGIATHEPITADAEFNRRWFE